MTAERTKEKMNGWENCYDEYCERKLINEGYADGGVRTTRWKKKYADYTETGWEREQDDERRKTKMSELNEGGNEPSEKDQ